MKKLFCLGVITALGLSAVETRAWRQTDFAEFEKGTLKRLSLRSDGRLTLAPAVKELFDPSVGYLWAVAEDSKGNLFVGGGSTTGTSARLYKIDKAGKSETVAELEGLQIQAIAIDARDGVYAATVPDGKVYKVLPGGKAEAFFDPKAKYIWSMVFGANNDLFVGTGDKGEIWRVNTSGQGSLFFKTDESHARSLATDGRGNLIVGTEPSGLVLRVTPDGHGFVLHQTAKREVTAVAVGKNGVIYASAVGTRGVTTLPAAAPPSTPPPAAAAPPAPGAVSVRVAGPAQPSGPPPTPAAPAVSGGSEVYRIEADGYTRRLWIHPSELVYSIALDGQDRPVIATGNKGGLYRLDSMQRYTLLTTLAPTQVTQLLTARSGGAMYAVSGNVGKVYQIGPGPAVDGVFESDLFDVGGFTYWGRLSIEGKSKIALQTRSGNLNDAHKNWSDWEGTSADGRIQSPAARFLQYRLTLSDVQAEVDSVDVKYQAKNVAPVVEQVEVTPANYKFPAPAAPYSGATPPPSLTLPAIGQKRSSHGAASGAGDAASGTSLSYAKGFTGVRWAANDENGDTLVFKLEIRGIRETEWKLLHDKLRERYYSWDSTAFADGEYVARVSAGDSPSNTPEQSLSAMLESDPFLIDNTAPEILGLTAAASGGKLNVTFQVKDALSNITRAEYSLNGGDWIVAEPTTRLSDAKELRYQLSIDRTGGGEFVVAVRVTDEFDNQSVAKASGK